METIKKTTICKLTEKFVEIETEDYIQLNGQEIKLDIPKHAVSYMNSPSQREQLQEQQPENIVSAVMVIWGKEPTVEEPEIPEPTKEAEEELQTGEE